NRRRPTILSACFLDGGAGAGEEPIVGVLELRIAQEDEMGEFLSERPRRPNQPHARFTEQAVAFSPVATPAGDHLVLPAVRGTAPRRGDDMVDRQLRRRHAFATVLAGTVVAQQQITPVGAKQATGDLDVGELPDDDDVSDEATPGHCLLASMPGSV